MEHGDASVVPPLLVRRALARLFESSGRFRMFETDDAVECYVRAWARR